MNKNLLNTISGKTEYTTEAFNIRENAKSIERNSTSNITITSKKDKNGIDITIKENTKGETVYIPVMITESGLTDKVYNDFYVGKNADITITAGCGICNNGCYESQHDGIHTFHLEEGARVKYIEKHYGEGADFGKRIINPKTIIELQKDSYLEIDSIQIGGVDSTLRETEGVLEDGSKLVITERILTANKQDAKTLFKINLNGKQSSTHIISRSIAKDNSKQEFQSKVIGNNDCYGHIECDAILMDKGTVKSTPEIYAKNPDARLIHEASIGKIAGEQLIKLMTLGLTEQEAEARIISGFME